VGFTGAIYTGLVFTTFSIESERTPVISERTFARSFDSFWQELLPLFTPRFVALFNEAYETVLSDDVGRELSALPVAFGLERLDIVAEFAFRLARIAHEAKIPLKNLQSEKTLCEKAEFQALELIRLYEGGQPADIVRLSEEEFSEGFRLCERYSAIYLAFPPNSPVQFCPTFPGAGFLNTSQGDLGIADSLIEVKTTTRKPAGKDIRQLIIYAALDGNAGNRRWTHVGLFNPRRGTLHHAEIDPLILRLSGGKPRSDVFAELISFAESNDPAIERKF
jgi:hypothetical protein